MCLAVYTRYVDKLKISDPIWQPMTLSEAEARKLAESFVQSAGLSDYVLYRVTPIYADNMGVAVFTVQQKIKSTLAIQNYFEKLLTGTTYNDIIDACVMYTCIYA